MKYKYVYNKIFTIELHGRVKLAIHVMLHRVSYFTNQ